MLNTVINARRTVLAFVLLALGVAFSGGVLAGKDGRSQEQVIKELYNAYFTSPMWCNEAKMARYLTADLAKLVSRTCKLDLDLSDPLATGQDPFAEEILRTLKVSPVSGSSTLYKARFTNGTPTTATIHLQKQNGEWRVSDIDADYPLRETLSAELKGQ